MSATLTSPAACARHSCARATSAQRGGGGAAAAVLGRAHPPASMGRLSTASLTFSQTTAARSCRSGRRSFTTRAVSEAGPVVESSGRKEKLVWELDFCSRPIVDERGKKVWELLVTDSERSFVFAEYFPNNKINSVTLKKALSEIIEQQGQKPEKIRYFRSQMQTIISRALGELEIKPVASRRCISLMGLVEERMETEYSQHPGYDPLSAPLISLEKGSPNELPDALRGEMWTYTELPLDLVKEEAAAVAKGATSFGAITSLERAGITLPPETTIPGVVVFSRRAAPLAAWTNGLEVANLIADMDRDCLILETGVSARWRYGSWVKTPDARQESQLWNAAKKAAKGLHFLAVQDDPESDTCSGFWLLWERDLPAY